MTAPEGFSGAVRFARFAYPPNELGLCGPADHAALLSYASGADCDQTSDARGLRELARGFDGAWPYLELIAGCNGIADPLAPPVVDAYWIGNTLSTRVPGADLARAIDSRFGGRAGRRLDTVLDAARAGLAPTHCFHVFAVYPWIGILRSGRTEPSLSVLDKCRIRWGTVESIDGSFATVRCRHLRHDESAGMLTLGPPVDEIVACERSGSVLAGDLRAGDTVALHWDWVCDRLAAHEVETLAAHSAHALAVANRLLAPAW